MQYLTADEARAWAFAEATRRGFGAERRLRSRASYL